MRKHKSSFFSRRRRTSRLFRYGRGCIERLSGAWIVVDRERRIILDGNSNFSELLCKTRQEYIGISIDVLEGQADETAGWPEQRFTQTLLDMPGRHEAVALRRGDGRQAFADVLISEPVPWNGRHVVLCWLVDRTELHELQSEFIDEYRKLRRVASSLDTSSLGDVARRVQDGSTRSDSVVPS